MTDAEFDAAQAYRSKVREAEALTQLAVAYMEDGAPLTASDRLAQASHILREAAHLRDQALGLRGAGAAA
ncbi:MAG: hypothetical protein ACREEW_07490 [Caulobacteraceae bacterium]